jgi:hypothetical protein
MTMGTVAAPPTILFFTPEALVTPHLVAQAMLAVTLKERGHRVAFATCPGLYPRCPVMDMHLLPGAIPPEQKARICAECGGHGQAILAKYGLPTIDLGEHLDDQAIAEVRGLIEHLPRDLRTFSYDGIPFGEICLHDLALASKRLDFDSVSPDDWMKWVQLISSAVLSYKIVHTLAERLPLASVVTHQDYALLLGARLAAERRGIRAYTVHAAWHRSVDRRHLVVVPEIEFQSLHASSQRWPSWKPLALGEDQVTEVADDLLTKFGAVEAHIYSPPKTFDEQGPLVQLGLSPDKPLVVAYTSSMDEYEAARVLRSCFGVPTGGGPQPFADQIAWIEALLAHFGRRDDAQLVVRVHPREGANKREHVVSEHLTRLRAAFGGSYRNCRIVWPEEKVSSYDLGELASLVLTSWSSMGLEMARLGVPVLAAFKGYYVWPHEPFLEWAPTPETYFDRLDQLLVQGAPPERTFENLKLAFRWYHQHALARTVDLSDLIPTPSYDGLPEFRTPRAAAVIEDVLAGGANIVDINLDRLIRAQRTDAHAVESRALKRHLRRLVHVLFTGQEPGSDFTLMYVQAHDAGESFLAGLPAGELSPDLHLFVSGPAGTRYLWAGRSVSRRSPMALRLARLGAQYHAVDRQAPAADQHIALTAAQ